MTEFMVRPYSETDASSWDRLVEASWNGTFLHTRKFLSYHRDRFTDVSLLFEAPNGSLLAVLPAALDPDNHSHVVSHPGSTYGGIVHNGSLRGEDMIRAITAAADHYRSTGLTGLSYKVVPYFYQAPPSSDDLYALFRLGAMRYRCDIASVIDLQHRPALNQRRKRSAKKAITLGVVLSEGTVEFEKLWPILEELLDSKFGVAPAHTLREILELHSLFPDEIKCVIAKVGDDPVAGCVYFQTRMALHAQYIAANSAGYEFAALDLVFAHLTQSAVQEGRRYFSFGISTENDGLSLNQGLYRYKNEFGAGGVAHEFYRIDLGAL